MGNIFLILLAHTFFLAWAPMILITRFPSVAPGVSANADIAAGLFLAVAVLFYGVSFCELIRSGGTPAAWDPPKKLSRGGLYAVTRNPMYLAMALVVWGLALYYRSRVLGVYGAVLLAGFHLFVVLHEEPALTKRFGKEYDEYRRRVRRWLFF